MQPPLTPMIDVTFQLLLFFLVAFQLPQPEGPIPATLPEAGRGRHEAPLARPIRIEIRPVGDNAALYEIDLYPKQMDDPNEVYSVLEARKNVAGTSDLPVVIKPTGNVRWRFAVEAFNAAVRAKFTSIAFAPSSS